MSEDKNQNMIPDKYDKLATLIILALGSLFTSMAAGGIGKGWIVYVLAGLVGLQGIFSLTARGRSGK